MARLRPLPPRARQASPRPWGEFHVERPTWRVLYNDWWSVWARAEGVGLVCGRPHGLVVVDFDDEAAWTWAQEHLAAVRGVLTRRGGHVHFAHPPRGIVGNRSGKRAVLLAPGVKCDVKGLGGMAVAPYSRHPSGRIYQPLGDWTLPVGELPELPEVVARGALDRRPVPAPRPLRRQESDPARALAAYLVKSRGIPPEGSGSDEAVFRFASWAKANTEATEHEFVDAVRREQPEFTEAWIASKWRSARGT